MPLQSSSRLLAASVAALAAALLTAACGDRPRLASSTAEAPEVSRFTRTIVADGLDEPMHMAFDSAGQVYVAERTGGVRRIDPRSGESVRIGSIPVFTDGEGGLLGILLDRRFEQTRRLFLYYMAAGDERIARLSRFSLDAQGMIDPASERVVMSWPHEVASHMGGGMAWEPGTGNLYLTTGENSVPTQYNPVHFSEPGGRREDSQRTAANTNDLRGKILRIHPEEDGSYTIPQGNLFPPGTAATRPEIYTMGNRNPWRVSVDPGTGALHWGEIGPDAGQDSAGIGPRGYDELNVATEPGNFGWPYFIGYNLGYNSFDPSTGQYGPPQDPARPINDSPNNSGLRVLPPAIPAVLAYPYAVSEEYPQLNSGGRAAVGGPVFRAAAFDDAPRAFPAYYDGRWFVVDFVRNWIMALELSEDRRQVRGMERFLPAERYNSPIDMQFGPKGDLFVLEYGRAPTGRLSRISYNAGNRPPEARVTASTRAGALPLRVELSARGSIEHDGDELSYAWTVTSADGAVQQRFSEPEPVLTLSRAGRYVARLTLRDAAGAQDTASLTILAGNEPPRVDLTLTRGNRTFFFPGDTIAYTTSVTDREDGSLADGTIAAERVAVTLEYLPAGLSRAELVEMGNISGESMRQVRALSIMAGSDCAGCHTAETASVGPAFRAVAERYAARPDAIPYLAEKIVAGGRGAWGEVPMPSHPGMSTQEAITLAEYVMSLNGAGGGRRSLPPAGRVALVADEPMRPGGAYLLRAAYTDRGAPGAFRLRGAEIFLLRHPLIPPEQADSISDGTAYTPSTNDPGFLINSDGAHLGFRGIDLSGIGAIEVGALTRFYTWSHFIGGSIEVRLGGVDGERIGGPVEVVPPAGAPPPDAPPDGAPSAGVVLGANLEAPKRIPLTPQTGLHDIYLVFRNAGAQPSDALMLLRSIEFIQAGGESP